MIIGFEAATKICIPRYSVIFILMTGFVFIYM